MLEKNIKNMHPISLRSTIRKNYSPINGGMDILISVIVIAVLISLGIWIILDIIPPMGPQLQL